MNAPYANNSFDGCGPGVNEEDLDRVEDSIGVRLPAPLRTHYLYCNGGRPEKREWVDREEGLVSYVVAVFFKITSVGSEEDFGFVDIHNRGVREGYLPDKFIPFARDQGGNFFCLDADSGHVVRYVLDVWDEASSQAENVVNATTYIASDLAAFVEGLVEEEDWDDEE